MLDTLIIGAGAAGLAAAQTLTRAGQAVRVLEARERVGGRILNVSDPTFPIPLDMGAEFIHGREAADSPWLRAAGVVPLTQGGEQLLLNGGQITPSKGMFAKAGIVLSVVDRLPGDLAFADLLRHPLTAHLDEGTKRLAQTLVEGFDAADPQEASSQALAREWGEGTTQEDAQFRPLGGYGALLKTLRQGLDVQLHTVVRELRWRSGHVTVTGERFGEACESTARRALVTLPLSLLQADAVRFSPPLGKKSALDGLRMGGVVKAVLLFDTPFWEARFPQASYFHAQGAPFLAFWTPSPLRVPLLSAWAGGSKAAALSGLSEAELVRAARESLRAFFGEHPAPAAVRVYGWQSDPYARGAYSY